MTDSDVVPEQVKDWLTPKLTLTLTPTLNSIQGQRLAHAHHVRTSPLTHPPSVSLFSGLGSWSFPQTVRLRVCRLGLGLVYITAHPRLDNDPDLGRDLDLVKSDGRRSRTG